MRRAFRLRSNRTVPTASIRYVLPVIFFRLAMAGLYGLGGSGSSNLRRFALSSEVCYKPEMAVFETIAAEIEGRINAGIYKPGQKIPSIRQVAAEFGCNKLTVQKAFEKLKRDGFLENIVGSGSFVRFPEKIDTSNTVHDFRTAYISDAFFPYREARTIFDRLFDTERSQLFSPTPVAGDPEFLRVLGETFHVPTERMFVISGAQQGLDLTAKVFSANISNSMLFEDPTYPGAISLFKARHFVALESDGPDLSLLDRALTERIRLFYAMPTIHNPTGISYGIKKKHAVAGRAEKHPFYVIEDDYLSEFLDPRTPRFVDIIPDRTIYIKSFSQTTAADIRMGFMVVPGALYDKFLYTKYSSDISSPGLLQKLVKALILNGGYADHVERIRTKALERKARLLELIRSCPALTVDLPQWGYSLWVRSAVSIDLPHVPWVRGKDFSFAPRHRDCFRVSFMNMDDSAFEKALIHLNDIFDRIFRR